MPDPRRAHPVGRLLARLAAPALTPLSDGELLARYYHTGCEAAFALLVTRHGGMARAAALRVLGNTSDADDAAQVAFALLAENAASLAECRSVGGWLHGTARRVALQLRRTQLRRAKRERRAAKPEAVTPADGAELAEALVALDAALAKLPHRLREAVVLCELEGLSRQTAAERLGIPEGTLSSRLASGRRQLARRLGGSAVATLLASSSGAGLPAAAAAVGWGTVASPAAKLILWEVKRMALFVKLKLVAATVGVAVGAVGVTAGAGGLMMAGGGVPAVEAAAPEEPPKVVKKAAVKPAAPEVKLSPEAKELQLLDAGTRFEQARAGVWKRVETASETENAGEIGPPVRADFTMIEEITFPPPGSLNRDRARLKLAVATPKGVRLIERDCEFTMDNDRTMDTGTAGEVIHGQLCFRFPSGVVGSGGEARASGSYALFGDKLQFRLALYKGLDTLFVPSPFGEARPLIGSYVLTFRRQPPAPPAPAPAVAPKPAPPPAEKPAPPPAVSPEAQALRAIDLRAKLPGLWTRTKVATASGKPARPELTLIEEMELLPESGGPSRLRFGVVVPGGGVRPLDRPAQYAVTPDWLPFTVESGILGEGEAVRFSAMADLAGDELTLSIPLDEGTETLFPTVRAVNELREQFRASNPTATSLRAPVVDTYNLTFRRQPPAKPAPAAALAPKAAAPAAPPALDKRVFELKRERVERLKLYSNALAQPDRLGQSDPEAERALRVLRVDLLEAELELAAPADALAKRGEFVAVLADLEQADLAEIEATKVMDGRLRALIGRAAELTRRRTEAEIEWLKAGGK